MFNASITMEGVLEWPIHTHAAFEVMFYLSGSGYMRTEEKRIPFSRNTVIVVPPGVRHGSTSENGFCNISVSAREFDLFPFSDVVSFETTEDSDGARLAQMLLRDAGAQPSYAASLLTAFAEFVLAGANHPSNPSDSALEKIRESVEKNYRDPNFRVSECLGGCGFSEDYIRARFRERFGTTPVAYLTRLRVDSAARLLEIFGSSRSVGEIGYLCGFLDEVYFSKIFKKYYGVSPSAYRGGKRGK